ncbi:MAG: hypothetical protein JST22_13725 [Bacteroidetes bacterium]|nr:hypothetical protein [Bacteroidota bacterium]
MLLRLITAAVSLLIPIMKLSAQQWEWMSGAYCGIHCRSRQFITAVGDHGIVIRSTDGGDHWQRLSTPTDRALWGVHFTDAMHGVAVGDSGIILRTSDGGTTWMPVPTGVQLGLRRVVFPTPSIGFAVGYFGVILKTIDGGLTWQQQNATVGITIVESTGLDFAEADVLFFYSLIHTLPWFSQGKHFIIPNKQPSSVTSVYDALRHSSTSRKQQYVESCGDALPIPISRVLDPATIQLHGASSPHSVCSGLAEYESAGLMQ